MRAVRPILFVSLVLLILPLTASHAHAQRRVPVARTRGAFVAPFLFPGFFPGLYGPGFGWGSPAYFSGFGGYNPGYNPYGYDASWAPYQYTLIPVANASTAGTYVPRSTYTRTNYISPTPYAEPSFIRPVGYPNTYYSSAMAEDWDNIRAAAYFSDNRAARPGYRYNPQGYAPPYYGPYCP